MRNLILEILDWCITKYGKSKFEERPLRLRVVKTGDCAGAYYYRSATIYIYLNHNKTDKQLVDTVIHEYTHYLQPGLDYLILDKYFEYKGHPLEIFAIKTAKSHTSECIKYLRNNKLV